VTPAPLRLACAALVGAALSFASAAHAAPTAADRETARTLMDQGRDLRDKGDLPEALKRFQAANEIMHVPTTAIEVAKAQVALGLLVEARDTVAALRQIPANHDSQLFKDARTKAEALDASLSGRVPSVTVSLKAPAPADTEVAIDGVVLPSGVLGLPRSVDPGHHVIIAKSATAEAKEEIDVREGEQKPVELALIVTAAAPVVETAPQSTEAETPAKKSHKPTALTFVGVGVAAGGAIAGTVTGIMAISKKSSLSKECPSEVCGTPFYSALDSANLMATLSDVSFGVAGAGAVLAIVTLAVGHKEGAQPPPPPSAGWTVTPWISGGEAGLRGSF
jgi:hypothetical protein